MYAVSTPQRVVYAIAALMLFATVPHCYAQDAVTAGGTILDQSGRAIPAAAVSVKNEAKNATQRTTSDTDGHFSVTACPRVLIPSKYRHPGSLRVPAPASILPRARPMPYRLP